MDSALQFKAIGRPNDENELDTAMDDVARLISSGDDAVKE